LRTSEERLRIAAASAEIGVYPANFCSFSGRVELRGFSDDFDEPVSTTGS
jgi:hypothetical protein